MLQQVGVGMSEKSVRGTSTVAHSESKTKGQRDTGTKGQNKKKDGTLKEEHNRVKGKKEGVEN